MSYIGAVAAFILTPILWVLYHKIFHVIYFDLGRGIIKELLACFFLSIFIVAIVMGAGSVLLGAAGGLLVGLFQIILFLLKWVLIIGAILGVISLIYKFITRNKETSENTETETTDTSIPPSEPANLTTTVETSRTVMPTVSDSIEPVQINTAIDNQNNQDYHLTNGIVPIEQSSTTIDKPKPAMMYCKFCGKQIQRTQKFCNFCGKGTGINN